MAALSVLAPYPIFNDRDGLPIDDGNIYIGTVNLDPVANPIQVYWDEALTIPASQPIKTNGGYPSFQGTPSTLYVNADDFSITVKDKNNLLVYTALQASLKLTMEQISGTIPSSRVTYENETVETALDRLNGYVETALDRLNGYGASVEDMADLATLTYATVSAGDTIFVRNARLLMEVLPILSTNAPYDYTASGGVKLTFVDGQTTHMSWGVKKTADTRPNAIDMAADLTDMVGFAAYANTTGANLGKCWRPNTVWAVGDKCWSNDDVYICTSGGTSSSSGNAVDGGPTGTGTGIVDGTVTWEWSHYCPIYWVTNDRSDRSQGSLRWAIESARTAVAGTTSGVPHRAAVLVHPRGQFDVTLRVQDTFKTIIIPNRCTVAAPGRNIRVYIPYDMTGFSFGDDAAPTSTVDAIFRFIHVEGIPDGATTVARDLVAVDPAYADRIWIDSCTFSRAADGAMDIATQTDLSVAGQYKEFTVSNCHFQKTDKVMLSGSLAWYNTLTPPTLDPYAQLQYIRLTLYRNFWDCNTQRQARIFTQSYTDIVNNVYRMMPWEDDTGFSSYSVYGAKVGTGGRCSSRSNVFMSALGTGYAGTSSFTTVYTPGTPATDGPGAIKDTGSATGDGITLTDYNPNDVPDPYTFYNLVPTPVVNTPEGRHAFMMDVLATVGAGADAAPEGNFRWDASSDIFPNGKTVLSATSSTGRWRRTDRSYMKPELVGGLLFEEVFPQDDTTLGIVSGVIDAPAFATYFRVDTEGLAATDDLVTINGGQDGRRILIRPNSGARTVVVKNGTGNIVLPTGDFTMDDATDMLQLVYDMNLAKWIEISRN